MNLLSLPRPSPTLTLLTHYWQLKTVFDLTKVKENIRGNCRGSQYGFRENREVIDAKIIIRQIKEKAIMEKGEIHCYLIDQKKEAFVKVHREDISKT